MGLDRIWIGRRHAGHPRIPDRTEGADQPVDVVDALVELLHPVAQGLEQLGGGLDRVDARLGDFDVDGSVGVDPDPERRWRPPATAKGSAGGGALYQASGSGRPMMSNTAAVSASVGYDAARGRPSGC